MAHIASKISKTTGIIASLRYFLALNTLHHIHISLIQPYLLYGIVLFFKNMPSASDYNSHAVSYFVSSSFLPLDLLYFNSVAIPMHDISNSLTPPNISLMFDYHVKHSRLNKQTKSLSIYAVKIWNSLPCEMRQRSKNNSNINVHHTLLGILSEENDYITGRPHKVCV